jgi:small subunit ribosomal protein S4
MSAHGNGTTPAETLHRLIETRLDNVVYRLGLAPSRPAARQMVSHGHITVDGRKTTIPSRQMRVGEVIGIREGSKDLPLFETYATRFASRAAGARAINRTFPITSTIRSIARPAA